MRFESVYRILFVLYCVEAGIFLALSPWTPSWERVAFLVPAAGVRHLISAPWMRGLVSGFGLVHLLWVAHDLSLWLAPAAADREPTSFPLRGQ